MKSLLHRLAVITSLVVAALMPTAPAPAVEPQAMTPIAVGTVPLGGMLQWDGAHVENSNMFWEQCDITHPCYHYYLDVPEGGSRLRIALDFEDRESKWAMRVRPPGGATPPPQYDPTTDFVADNYVLFGGMTTLEVPVPDADASKGSGPVPGRYLISVAADEVADDDFRMRAVLDAPGIESGAPPVPLLPNARVVPPYNMTFDGPTDAQAVERPTHYGELGIRQSCSEDEKHVDGATVCLRLSAGGFNEGDGPLAIRWDAGNMADTKASQTITWSDGSQTVEDGGSFEFHAPHRHFHYVDAMLYELYDVTNDDQVERAYERGVNGPPGRLEFAGDGAKRSYCMVDYVIADWDSTDQQSPTEPTAVGSNCGSVRNRPFNTVADEEVEYEGRIGWSRGWGDVYPTWRQGQYVEFANAPGNGLYVLRVEFDRFDHLRELDETDNTAYALIRVSGYPDEPLVETLERGFGTDPWDREAQPIGLDELRWTQ